MDGVGLLIHHAGLELVIFVNTETPILVQPQVGIKREFAAIHVIRIALQILMSDSDLNIRIDRPVTGGIDLPKPVVQERNLRIDREKCPGNGLEFDLVEHVGEKLLWGGEWGGAGNTRNGGRNDLRQRVIEVHVKIGVNRKPVDGCGISTRLKSVAHAETQNCPTLERIDRIELRKIDRLQSCTRNVL